MFSLELKGIQALRRVSPDALFAKSDSRCRAIAVTVSSLMASAETDPDFAELPPLATEQGNVQAAPIGISATRCRLFFR